MLVTGDRLSDATRADVLRRYVHRRMDTTYKTDAEWLAAHAFYVTRAGNLDFRYQHCEPRFMAEVGNE